ncbi:MAG: ribosomal-processing cysteine protease Prp [Bacilli bacterium]|nr:ribosomal-processing cysteine protease Prp [Bacilli bacterium]
MIKVFIESTNHRINKIIINGHAKYDDYGKDIVCSAASTCVITTVNGISEINDQYLNIVENKDELIIEIKENDSVCEKLIKNMLNILEDLEKQYPKNIKIK